MRNIVALVVSFLASLPALGAEGDMPGRVGRVSWTQGAVSVFSDPELGWEKGYVNTPLTSENSLWTDPAARAELRIGSAAIRLDETTQLDIARLDDTQLRANVTRGRIAVSIRNFENGDSWIVATPEARFELRGNGRYRIDADIDRMQTVITVFAGSARLLGVAGRTNVDSGQAMRVLGGPQPEFEVVGAVQMEFDQWAQARDERVSDRVASQYVSPNMTGYEELDAYGEWNNDPNYGTVWYPSRVAVDWAPYRYGRWSWVRPWGWTWVDDAPWGYAPFHYGRWAYIGSRWAWYPGSYVSRPAWSPALVAWVGKPGWNINVRSGNAPVIGWYPLAPHDRFQPWYTNNSNYINNVNRVVITNRPAPRENWNRDRGATVVERGNFGSRPVHNHMVPVTRDLVQNQGISRGDAVLPSRNDFRGRNRPPESAAAAPGARPVNPGERVGTPAPSAPGAPAPVARPSAAPAPNYNPRPSNNTLIAPTPSNNAQPPRPTYNTQTPAPGNNVQTPRPGINTQAPAPGNNVQAPRPGNNTMIPAPPSATPVPAPNPGAAVQGNAPTRAPRPSAAERERQQSTPDNPVPRSRPTTREAAPVAREAPQAPQDRAARSPVPVEQRQRPVQEQQQRPPAAQPQQQQQQQQQQEQPRPAPASKPAVVKEAKPDNNNNDDRPARGGKER
jgi:hypothetical protein